MARTVTLGKGLGPSSSSYAAATAPSAGKTGRPRGLGRGKFSGLQSGDTFHLWLLLALELTATWALRRWSRNHHGG